MSFVYYFYLFIGHSSIIVLPLEIVDLVFMSSLLRIWEVEVLEFESHDEKLIQVDTVSL